MNYAIAKHIGDQLVECLGPACQRIEIAGSVRREKPECKDLELVCIPRLGGPRPEFGQKPFGNWLDQALFNLEQSSCFGSRLKDGEKYKQLVVKTEAFGFITTELFKLDLFIVRPETWGVQFAIRTGSSDFSHKLVTPRSWGGWLPDHMKVKDGLLWNAKPESVIETLEECDFFQAIGLGWVDPQLRV